MALVSLRPVLLVLRAQQASLLIVYKSNVEQTEDITVDAISIVEHVAGSSSVEHQTAGNPQQSLRGLVSRAFLILNVEVRS